LVITIEDSVIQHCIENPSQSMNLLQLIPLLIQEKHKLFIDMTKNDISLYKSSIFSSFEEYLKSYIKKVEKQKEEIIKSTRHFVHIVLDESRINELLSIYQAIHPKACINKFNNGNRLLIKMDGKTLEIITTKIIQEYLCSPLKIIVEDIESDKLFIEKCIECFTGLNCDELFIDFINGSGSNTKKNLLYYSTKSYRVFCIIDSDEVGPGEYVDPTKEKFISEVVDTCESFGYNHYVLSKREIENYIPENLLLIRKNSGNEKFFSLTDIQKDYFDMKYGIKAKDLKYKIWKQIGDINQYTDKNDIIINGFGKRIWQAFREVSTSQELSSRDNRNELEKLVNDLLDVI
jgi:hypothetical protein